jgi:quercetin dioxygenase-like cupin family protein
MIRLANARVIRVEDLPGSESSEVFHGHDHGAHVSFFLSHVNAGEGPGLHRHPYEEIFIVQGGEVTFVVGDETIEVGAGDILIVPPGIPHKFVVNTEGHRSVNIHPVSWMKTEWLES